MFKTFLKMFVPGMISAVFSIFAGYIGEQIGTKLVMKTMDGKTKEKYASVPEGEES